MHKPHKLVPLIWHNCAEVAAFALSRRSAQAMRERFEGYWRPLDGVLFEIPEERADRALLELGTLMRALDDAEGLSDELARLGDAPYGYVLKREEGEEVREDLYFRDMTNKILHAGEFVWMDAADYGPVVKCVSNDPGRWIEAQIRLDRLLAFCGQLGLG